MKSKTKGRKRKVTVSREANGRPRRERITPTVEAIARRYALSPNDITKADYPLGRMLANLPSDTFTPEMHQAGCRYAWLYAIAIGKMTVTAQSYDAEHRGRNFATGEQDDMWLKRRGAEFDSASMALKSLSQRHLDLARQVCVEERSPVWMGPAWPDEKVCPAWIAEARMLREALRALAQTFALMGRAA